MSHKSNATTERAPRDITRHRNAPLARRTNRDDGNDFRQWHMDHRRMNTRCVHTHTHQQVTAAPATSRTAQCASHSGEPQAAPINDRATPTPTQADIDQPVEPPQGLNGRGARTNVNTRRRDQTLAPHIRVAPRSSTQCTCITMTHVSARARTTMRTSSSTNLVIVPHQRQRAWGE